MRPDSSSGARALVSIDLDNRLLGQNPDPPDGYPIVNLNWILVPVSGSAARLPALKTSLSYILSQAGQDDAEQLGYLPLPKPLRNQALSQLSLLKR